MKLTDKDRKAIGAFLTSQAQRDREPPTVSPEFMRGIAEAAYNSAFNSFRSFGLSAEGAKMLIEGSRRTSAGSSARFMLQGAIGEQLSREQPDPIILNDLVARSAAEEARLEQLEKRELIRVAGRLTPSDRQRLGDLLRVAATESLNGKPVLEIVP